VNAWEAVDLRMGRSMWVRDGASIRTEVDVFCVLGSSSRDKADSVSWARRWTE
jgi:hypothetical protein